MDIYKEIKEQVSTKRAASCYGFDIKQNGMTRCPFHDDRTPSMKVGRNFYCFGCGEKGDVIDFTAKLFGLTPYEAARKLASDFHISVTRDGREKSKLRNVCRAKRDRMEEQLFNRAVKRAYNTYCCYYRLLNGWTDAFAPESPDEEYHPLFVMAMQKRDFVEYLLDQLLYGLAEEKADIVIRRGKEIRELEKQMDEYETRDPERTARDSGKAPAGHDDGGGNGSP